MPSASSALKNLASVPINDSAEQVMKELRMAGLKSVLETAPAQPVEITVNEEGAVNLSWWSPQGANITCDLCGKQGTRDCLYCMNTNPWCG